MNETYTPNEVAKLFKTTKHTGYAWKTFLP